MRETRDHIRVFLGPREVAVHDKVVTLGGKQRRTLSEHRPARGQGAAAIPRHPGWPGYGDVGEKAPVHRDATALPFGKSLVVGIFQCLAMVPGVSRSGATIVGALLLGVEKRAAAEFSFLLSLPTMGAAVAYDLFKNRDVLDFGAIWEIAVGFAAVSYTHLTLPTSDLV